MQQEARIGCEDLAGHEHELLVFNDRAGLVLVSPPGAWAVLGPRQVEQLRTALVVPANDGKVPGGHG